MSRVSVKSDVRKKHRAQGTGEEGVRYEEIAQGTGHRAQGKKV